MGLFVDEQVGTEGVVLRRMMMSNISVTELNAEAFKLGIPLVEQFAKNRLPHYMLTEPQRLTAIADGAEAIAYNSQEWRTVHAYAKKLPREVELPTL